MNTGTTHKRVATDATLRLPAGPGASFTSSRAARRTASRKHSGTAKLSRLGLHVLTLLAILIGLPASASDLNEVASLLVYPVIAAFDGQGAVGTTETFVTITNTAPWDLVAHASFINGDETDADYCFECNFDIPLTGGDTETLVITQTPTGTNIGSLDATLSRSCAFQLGMLVVSLEDPDTGETVTDNVLFGEEIVVNYTQGYAFSIPAIPFQGIGGNGDREFAFNDVEYRGFPRRVAADFLAPNHPQSGLPMFTAELVTFTLGFETQHPPLTDCRVNGFDAAENNFSNSFQFGCWTIRDLCDMDPEFCWPNLGLTPGISDTHGWLAVDCDVDGADGGVHGSIIQIADPGADIDKDGNPFEATAGSMAWARTLYQSGTAGDATTLFTNPPPPPSGGW
ncbi:MAG: hypothetical protein GY716_10870 [bacterium]|nr:hypothetical protein [bacterium]